MPSSTFEEDGFEIIEDPALGAREVKPEPDAGDAAHPRAPVAGPSSRPAGSAPASRKPLQLGALVLELGGEDKRSRAAAAAAAGADSHAAARDKPRLLLYLNRQNSARSAGGATTWRPFDVGLAEGQVELPWRTVGRPSDAAREGDADENDDAPMRPAGDAAPALRALHAAITQGSAEAEWALEEARETLHTLARYRLVVRVALHAAEHGSANLRAFVAQEAEKRQVAGERKHLLYALRRDRAASSKTAFSVSAAAETQPEWLLKDSHQDERMTLRELYNRIPPPEAEPWLSFDEPYRGRVRSLVLQENGVPHIETKLFNYQRRTVAHLLRRELGAGHQDTLDPRFTACQSVDGEAFFLDCETFSIWKEQRLVSQMAGSILCEHMGLGKTLECITLIALTRGERSNLEPPGAIIPEDVKRAPEAGAGSESFLCRPRAIAKPRGSHHAPRVSMNAIAPLRFYRTATSLVCVPVELLPQWVEQLSEHLSVAPHFVSFGMNAPGGSAAEQDEVARLELIMQELRGQDPEANGEAGHGQANGNGEGHDEEPMRILVLYGNSGHMPDAEHLAQFDIVLMTMQCLQAEWARCDGLRLRWPGIPRGCTCAYLGKKSGCTCAAAPRKAASPPVSPLMQLLFRRLIVDEGHVLASASSSLVMMARHISAQSRLMVSGTPTASLVGSAPEDIGKALPLPGDAAHLWKLAEVRDLERIGLLMAHFFIHPLFAPPEAREEDVVGVQSPSWTSCMVKPLNAMDSNSLPDFGAVARLRGVFAHVFVRSGDQAREEVRLPSCDDKVIWLTMNAAERANFNYMQALIALNNLSAGKRWFARGNEEPTAQAVKNVKHCNFWFHASEVEANLVSTLDHPEQLVNPTFEDRQKHEEALTKLRDAVNYASTTGRIGATLRCFTTSQLDDLLQQWASSVPENEELPYNFNAEGCIKVRRILHLIQDGRTPTHDELLDAFERVHRDHFNVLFEEDDLQTDELIDELYLPYYHEQASQEGQRPRIEAPKETTDEVKTKKAEYKDDTIITPQLKVPRSIAETKVVATSSTKLSWVFDYIKALPPGDKVAIFSSLTNVRVAVADLLDLAQIPFAMYWAGMTKQEKTTELNRFRKADDVRICIMDFHSGGRGHNLQVASHCVFLEAVWSLDSELQAIKRFHRLGQKKEVKVNTLIMKGTFEEDLIMRRRAIKQEQADGSIASYAANVSTSIGGREADILADSGMRAIFAKPRYVDAGNGHTRPEPFTRFQHPIYPFAHIDRRTGEPILEDDVDASDDDDDHDDDFEPLRPSRPRTVPRQSNGVSSADSSPRAARPNRVVRGGPSSLIGARRQNLAAMQERSQAPGPTGNRGIVKGKGKVRQVDEAGPSAGPSSKRARFSL